MKKGLKVVMTFFSKNIDKRTPLLLCNVGGAARKEIGMPPDDKQPIMAEDFYVTFRRDVAAFREKLPQLLEQFPGEYVAILDGEVVCHMTKWENLVDLTQKQYPDRFVLLEKVAPRTTALIDMDTLEG